MLKKFLMVLILASLSLAACSPAPTPTAAPTEAPTLPPTEVIPTEPPATPTYEIVKVTVASYPYMTEAPYFIAQEEGFFAEQGLEVEFLPFEKSTDVLPALVQGQLDVSTVFVGAGFLNAISGGGQTRLVAGKGFLDASTCGYTGWMASAAVADSGALDDIANWAGKKIATEKGTTSQYALEVLLAQAGLTIDDVELMDVPVFNRLDAIKNGAVDIAGAGEPWILRMETSGDAKLVKAFSSYLPDLQWGTVAFGPTLLIDHPDVGVRFMRAFLKGLAQYNEGKTDRNVEIIAKYTQLTPEEVKATCWQTMRADGDLNQQSVLDIQQWLLEKGFVTSLLPIEQIWDPQFIQAAGGQ